MIDAPVSRNNDEDDSVPIPTESEGQANISDQEEE